MIQDHKIVDEILEKNEENFQHNFEKFEIVIFHFYSNIVLYI
jgi:hypothetical protein